MSSSTDHNDDRAVGNDAGVAIDSGVAADRPSLEAARQFTRDLGPATMAVGAMTSVLALVLHMMDSAFAAYFALPLGLVLFLFGAAAFARTESLIGQLVRWAVVGVFVFGGGYALFHWAQLIWGSRGAVVQGDLTMMGFYLMAGPALLVPAGLAVVRPGWVPLIVTPAIVALVSAGWVGYSTLLFLTLAESPLPDVSIFAGVILANLALFLYSAQRGLVIARSASTL